jgi:hypothetical protein
MRPCREHRLKQESMFLMHGLRFFTQAHAFKEMSSDNHAQVYVCWMFFKIFKVNVI